MRALDGRLPVAVVGDRDLADARLPAAARRVEHLAQLGLGLRGDHQVGLAPGERARPAPGDGDADRHALVRQVPQPRGLDVEVLAAVVDVAAVEQRADDVHGLGEHLVPHADRGPALPTTCSLRFSPEPSPSRNRPPERICIVAAFWATTAGW